MSAFAPVGGGGALGADARSVLILVLLAAVAGGAACVATAEGERVSNKGVPPQEPRAERNALVEEINRARRRAGERALVRNAALERAAQAHADFLAANGRLSHRGRNGRSPAERAADAGYGPFAALGENLAQSPGPPARVVESWLESRRHRQILLAGRYTEIGLGIAVVRGSPPGHRVWVALFAAPAAR